MYPYSIHEVVAWHRSSALRMSREAICTIVAGETWPGMAADDVDPTVRALLNQVVIDTGDSPVPDRQYIARHLGRRSQMPGSIR